MRVSGLTLAFALVLEGARGSAAAGSERPSALHATAATVFDDGPIRFALLEASTEITAHLTLGAGLAYLGPSEGPEDLQVRALLTASVTTGRFAIQSRHLISRGSVSATRYRNRLRVVRPGLFGLGGLSVRAFDELSLDVDRGELLRNSLALGIGAQLSPRLSAEVYHIWVDDRRSPPRPSVLVLVTWRVAP